MILIFLLTFIQWATFLSTLSTVKNHGPSEPHRSCNLLGGEIFSLIFNHALIEHFRRKLGPNRIFFSTLRCFVVINLKEWAKLLGEIE